MSITIEPVEADVIRLRCRSWRGVAVGYEVSAYVLRGVLVDTGFPRVSAAFLDATRAMSLRGAVVTHWHEDHSGSAPALAATGMPLVLDPRCETTLRDRPDVALYRSAIWGRTARLSAPVTPFDPAPLQLIATPGHTPDHQVLWDAERGIVASGDLFLGVKVRVAHEHESPRELVQSLKRIVALEPRLLLDAHRGPLTNVGPLLRAKIGWMEETIGAIMELARAGAHESEIRRRVLGREDLVGWASFGEYSKRALVRAVLREKGRDD
jgi:glyoxylase-like metal-dependent hydrolase (beta-lactamase superfamily II)